VTAYNTIIVDGGLARGHWEGSGHLGWFVRRIITLHREHSPNMIAVAWDSPHEGSIRREISKSYKADRSDPGDEFHLAVQEVKAVLPWFDVVQYCAPRAEADDVLFSLSRSLPPRSLVVSADKDLLQVVSPEVDFLKAGTRRSIPDVLVTANNIRDTPIKMGGCSCTGLDATGWTSLLALSGDRVDGVPGLPKVGPGRALAILRACPDFVSLVLAGREDEARQQIYAVDDSVSKWVEVAVSHREDLRESLDLVRLYLVDLDILNMPDDDYRALAWVHAHDMEDFVFGE